MNQVDSELKTSPMMLQWQQCKEIAKEAVLLFRMGDFYEAFYSDAEILSKELDLTLTKRQEVPMSGVPFHSSEPYIDKLVAKGYRVAVAEQTEDPKKAKGLVKREIVRVVTPGSLITSSLLSDKSNNFFASIARVGSMFGLAVLDLTTADFRVIEFDKESDLINEIYRLKPAEILTSERFKRNQANLLEEIKKTSDLLLSTDQDFCFEHQAALDFLLARFKVHHLDGFGLKGMTAGINAAGGLLHYIQDTLCIPIDHIRTISPYSTAQYMALDRATQRNLELSESLRDGSKKNTLLSLLDQTRTPMGGRLMRQWVKLPLLATDEILKRQEAVQAFITHAAYADRLNPLLDCIKDIERIMMKISSGYATPRDIAALRYSFEPMPHIKALLQFVSLDSPLIAQEAEKLESLNAMVELISRAIQDDPPLRITEGHIFKEGYHAELDEIRLLSLDSKSWIARYQTQLRDQTGIKTLKVGFNRMFGYYIEVSKGQAEKMPDIFQRRQTLVNAERFITPELKSFESRILTAEEKMVALESELFNALRLQIAQYAEIVMRVAQGIARIDCLKALSEAARKHHYTRPIVDYSQVLEIIEGRHPIIEASQNADKFIPNDTLLDDQSNRLLLITGPNMAGKSTYIRQVALITIMAQIGSFVPAKSAHIGIVDKVFTRIGASDDLSLGLSTFMVEMTEAANILNNATSRSLVILDEIGRGTSTYDGISIAWSIAEYLLTAEDKQAKTLFATHYWELTKLEEKVPGAVNFNVAVHESQDNIIFLRKIVRGGTDKSYGIHVGRLAGLPEPVISRAKEILVHLEENANRKSAFEPSKPIRKNIKEKPPLQAIQLTFFGN